MERKNNVEKLTEVKENVIRIDENVKEIKTSLAGLASSMSTIEQRTNTTNEEMIRLKITSENHRTDSIEYRARMSKEMEVIKAQLSKDMEEVKKIVNDHADRIENIEKIIAKVQGFSWNWPLITGLLGLISTVLGILYFFKK